MDGNTKHNLVSTWECEEPILKNVWFEKEITSYPHFIVYDFETLLALLNEHLTDDLTYLSRHIPIRVAIHDTLSKELVYLVDENPGRLIERFIEVYKDVLDVFLKTRRDSELEGKDIEKAKSVGFRVYDQGMVTNSDYLPIMISVMSWPMAFIQGC